MDKILGFVEELLTYLKEGKAAEIINMIKKFIEDIFNKGDAAE